MSLAHDHRLPELRQDLRIESAEGGPGGTAAWVIVDAAQHRYVKIDEAAYALLSTWNSGATYAELRDAVAATYDLKVSDQEISDFVKFLETNSLTVEPAEGGWRHYAGVAARGKRGLLMWLVHNYLFIKLPLFRPEPTLRLLATYIAILYSRRFFALVGLSGLAGLYMLSRQWDVFLSTFQHFFSWQGAAVYAVALIIIKSAHELGHAFTAIRYGCRVPSMGICFLVLFPVLYTDVSDAWRLRGRAERLAIGSAGMIVELALACFATVLWVFLPEGILKSLAFSIATVGWVLSLAINLNPLMRFDGYYLMADALGVDNLQARAFAFGQWRLREVLFALGAPKPEALPSTTERILIAYAWTVWIYRLVLFTGIALLVYHMAFKLLGIILFLIEIIYFVARPIYQETARWWNNRSEIKVTGRSRITAAALIASLMAFVVPWSTTVRAPAVLEAKEIQRIFPQRAGIIERIEAKVGESIKSGDAILIMTSSELNHQISVASKKIALVKMRLSRRSVDDVERANSLSLEQQLQALNSELAGLHREKADLIVRASVSGQIAEFGPGIHVGRAITRAEPVALVRGHEGRVARGYISASDLERVEVGAEGAFFPETFGAPRIPLQMTDLAKAGAATIDIPELASVYGGAIAVRSQIVDSGHKKLVPVEPQYLSVMKAVGNDVVSNASVRGTIEIRGRAESLAMRVWKQVAAVLIRESGF